MLLSVDQPFPSGYDVPAADRRLQRVSDFDAEPGVMRQQVGTAMQAVVLMALPLLIPFQLLYGMPLVVMPVLTLTGIVLFTVGHHLRNKDR